MRGATISSYEYLFISFFKDAFMWCEQRTAEPIIECGTLDTPFAKLFAPDGTLVATETVSDGMVKFEVKDPVSGPNYVVKAGGRNPLM